MPPLVQLKRAKVRAMLLAPELARAKEKGSSAADKIRERLEIKQR